MFCHAARIWEFENLATETLQVTTSPWHFSRCANTPSCGSCQTLVESLVTPLNVLTPTEKLLVCRVARSFESVYKSGHISTRRGTNGPGELILLMVIEMRFFFVLDRFISRLLAMTSLLPSLLDMNYSFIITVLPSIPPALLTSTLSSSRLLERFLLPASLERPFKALISIL